MEAAVRASRRGTGKALAKDCRKAGLVPAVVYGKSIEPVAISLDQEGVRQLLRYSRGQVHNLIVEDPHFEGAVMIQDVSYEPVTGEIIHIDLHRISLTDNVKAEVAVDVSGEEAIEKRGLLVQRQSRVITVECLPAEMPAVFEVDVTKLQPGDSISAGDLIMPEGVKLITPPTEVLVVVLAPRAVEEEEEETEEAEGEVAADEPVPESDI